MRDDDLHQLAGLYAPGASDADEDARFQAHLADCTACQDEVREFAAVRDQLGQGVAEPAPAHPREQVLARGRHLSLRSSTPGAARREAGPPSSGVLAAAAAVVLIVGGLAYANVRPDRERPTISSPSPRALDADDGPARRRRRRGCGSWPPAFFGEGVLVAGDPAPPGSDHEYQLMLEGSKAVPGITLEPDDGRVHERFDARFRFRRHGSDHRTGRRPGSAHAPANTPARPERCPLCRSGPSRSHGGAEGRSMAGSG